MNIPHTPPGPSGAITFYPPADLAAVQFSIGVAAGGDSVVVAPEFFEAAKGLVPSGTNIKIESQPLE